MLARRLALYVATQACCLTVLDARHGEPLGTGKDAWLRPKHSDAALALVLLDAAGAPVQAPPGPCALPWVGNAPPPKQASPEMDPQPDWAGMRLRSALHIHPAQYACCTGPMGGGLIGVLSCGRTRGRSCCTAKPDEQQG